MCMDKWPIDIVDHPSIPVCLLEHRVGSRECEHMHFKSFWDPIPLIRCHTGSIGMVANYYVTLAILLTFRGNTSVKDHILTITRCKHCPK